MMYDREKAKRHETNVNIYINNYRLI